MDDVAGARCLVLGGGGFIGTNLCLTLLAGGARVEGFGRRPLHAALAHIPWHEAAFVDAERLAAAIAGQDYVIHLLGGRLPAQSNQDPARDVEENLLPTLRLIDLCRNAGTKRLVFASSGGTVYGVNGPDPIREDDATDPITAYGINKLAAEKYIGLARQLHGFDAVVLRISNPFGPFQLPHRPQGIVGTLLARALTGKEVEIWGDGSIVRDFVHVQDVVDAVIASLSYAGREWTFNVGSGEGRSLRAVVAAVAAVTGMGADRVRYLPGRDADVPVNILDVGRIRAAMGWHPRVGWDEGLAATAKWMRQTLADGGSIPAIG